MCSYLLAWSFLAKDPDQPRQHGPNPLTKQKAKRTILNTCPTCTRWTIPLCHTHCYSTDHARTHAYTLALVLTCNHRYTHAHTSTTMDIRESCVKYAWRAAQEQRIADKSPQPSPPLISTILVRNIPCQRQGLRMTLLV